VKEKPRMPEQQWRSANFCFLAVYDAQLVSLGALAERYFKEDPATSLIKVRQYGETLAQLVAAKAGLFRDTQEPQADLLRRLKFDRVIPREVGDFFHHLRTLGNKATHENDGTHAEALTALKIARELGPARGTGAFFVPVQSVRA
jgi:type I restriction enzyme, R subunit